MISVSLGNQSFQAPIVASSSDSALSTFSPRHSAFGGNRAGGAAKVAVKTLLPRLIIL